MQKNLTPDDSLQNAKDELQVTNDLSQNAKDELQVTDDSSQNAKDELPKTNALSNYQRQILHAQKMKHHGASYVMVFVFLIQISAAL